ncbi:hypothetical protein B0H34DRAFT_793215 [Crassisporium funariophilum]|nr:hypothetical protein B0H34DRAFT_793215 [Crassisporium funariophilum]
MVISVLNAAAPQGTANTIPGTSQANNNPANMTAPTVLLVPAVPAVPAASPPRVPRTHTSPNIIQMLKTLCLTNILKQNKKIEAKNEARTLKTFDHIVEPVNYPDPGSKTASPHYHRPQRSEQT